MKKNLMVLVSLALILVVSGWEAWPREHRPGAATGPGQSVAPGQKADESAVVEIPFPRVGDRARYAVTRNKKQGSRESTMTIDVTAEITGADESGFLVQWTYGEWHTDPPDAAADPEAQSLLKLLYGVPSLLQVDPMAEDVKVVNLEEIQGQLAKALDEVEKKMGTLGISQQVSERARSLTDSLLQDRDFVTGAYTKEANLIFFLLGRRIPASGPLENDMELPNFLGGDPIPARERLLVKTHDPANHRALVLVTRTLDRARMPKILGKFVRDLAAKFAPEFPANMLDGLSFKSFSMDTTAELDLDLESGWPDSLSYKALITMAMTMPGEESATKDTQEEAISMRRIKGEGNPVSQGLRMDWQALYGESLDLYNREHYERALELGNRALELAEKALGPDHPDVAMVINHLASLYDDQEEYARAEPLYKRMLTIKEKALGPDHPEVAEVLESLALLYENQEHYAQAEPVYKRLLTIKEKAFGPDHPDVAAALDDLASLYDGQKQYAKAEPLYRRSLAITEKAVGPDHEDVAWSLDSLAELYLNQGQYAKAEPLCRRSLAIREKAFGPDHRSVALSLDNLVRLYRATKREKEAQELEARVARIRSIDQ